MPETTLSPQMEQELARLRAEGCRIVGPAPVTPGETPPTADTKVAMPGMHVQIVRGSTLVEGFGATADEAARDAIGKLVGYKATGHAPPAGG